MFATTGLGACATTTPTRLWGRRSPRVWRPGRDLRKKQHGCKAFMFQFGIQSPENGFIWFHGTWSLCISFRCWRTPQSLIIWEYDGWFLGLFKVSKQGKLSKVAQDLKPGGCKRFYFYYVGRWSTLITVVIFQLVWNYHYRWSVGCRSHSTVLMDLLQPFHAHVKGSY